MKKLIALLGLCLVLNANATDFPDDAGLMKLLGIDSDSGIRGPVYSKIVDELKNLEGSYPEFAQVITYGKSLGGRPLTLIKIAKKGIAVTNPTAVYIGGSIHGDEYLNIEDRLPRWFLEQTAGANSISTFLSQGGVIYVAPILNPDGYDSRDRENQRGVDLNRDYTVVMARVEGFKEPETKSLVDYLKQDIQTSSRKLAVAMDYHCCIGALLYPWSFTGPTLSNEAKQKHLRVVQHMNTNLGTEMSAGTTPVILGYSAKGTSKDFYYEAFGALGFTFEGRRGKENKFFTEHTAMWEDIIQDLVQ